MPPDTFGLFLLVTGLATTGVVMLALAPAAISRAVFGQEPADDLAFFLTRYVGLLVALVGGLLVWSAYRPESRVPVLIVAVLEKAPFALAIFVSPFRRRPPALFAALADAGMALAYLTYLATLWSVPS